MLKDGGGGVEREGPLLGGPPPLCFPLLGDVASAEQAEGDEEGDSDWSEQSGHESNSGGSEGSDGQPVLSPIAPPLARSRNQSRGADNRLFINLTSRKTHRGRAFEVGRTYCGRRLFSGRYCRLASLAEDTSAVWCLRCEVAVVNSAAPQELETESESPGTQ